MGKKKKKRCYSVVASVPLFDILRSSSLSLTFWRTSNLPTTLQTTLPWQLLMVHTIIASVMCLIDIMEIVVPLLAGTRRRPAAEDGVPPSLQIPPHTHIMLARSPVPYSPFRRRAHSPTAFSGPMARPPPSPPRPPPSHMHGGWMVSATRTPTSSAPSQDYLFPRYM